jgi:hypothetical protein
MKHLKSYENIIEYQIGEYVKTLKRIDELDLSNRGDAEMWVCSNYPIAATACQVFIDYDSKGKFKPFEITSNI